MRSLTPMVKNLLILNIGMFFIGVVLKGNIIESFFALRYFESPLFLPIQLFTYMFLHANFPHLLGNMLSLFFFGPMLEMHWGAKRFVLFWVICGIGAAIVYSSVRYYEVKQLEAARNAFNQEPSFEAFLSFERKLGQDVFTIDFKEDFEDNPSSPQLMANAREGINQVMRKIIDSPVIGASGAVFGVLMAFALLFPNTELMLLFFPVPIKAKYFVLLYGAFELFMGVARVPGDNIAHFAHLGGALVGFILVKYWQKNRNIFY
jgi:membrane associated rhomboid family serine protease